MQRNISLLLEFSELHRNSITTTLALEGKWFSSLAWLWKKTGFKVIDTQATKEFLVHPVIRRSGFVCGKGLRILTFRIKVKLILESWIEGRINETWARVSFDPFCSLPNKILFIQRWQSDINNGIKVRVIDPSWSKWYGHLMTCLLSNECTKFWL